MKSIRISWIAGWPMILALAGLPAVVTAQTGQPFPAGDRGEAALSQGLPLTMNAVEALAASPATFGTTYVTVAAQEFSNFYTGTYQNAGSGLLRWPVSGSPNSFMMAPVALPTGVTVTEVEFYIHDSNASYNASVYLYRGTPETNTFSTPVTGISTGSSGAIQTVVLSFSPFEFDSSKQRLTLAFYAEPVFDGTLAIAGARIGYTGAPGQLIMFPAPDRFVDTRSGRGGKSSKYVDGEAFDHTITGVAGLDGNVIPAGAKAILGNVVAVNATQNGLFKILPGGTVTTLGRASVNFNGGFNTGNAFTVRLDSLGRIRGFHSSSGGTTDLIVDVVGYYR